LLGLPWSAKQQARYEAMALQSLEDQRAIEAADTMPFEIYRQEYTSPTRLGRPQMAAGVAA
jgi:glutamate--cysteine ligase